jgi:hypothetical protein
MTPRDGGITWRTPGLLGYVALVATLLALLALGLLVLPLADALRARGEAPTAAAVDVAEQRAAYAQRMDRWAANARGRSMFFIPPEPIKEEPVVVEDPPDEPEDRPDPTPTRYRGPEVIAAMNGQIWLEGGAVVKMGEEAEGVTLLNDDDVPWSVRVEWRGQEFDVPIFERTTSRFLEPSTE